MSMLDSMFKQPFRAAKCKTLLKLTIPRIKLLRNRREVQIKHMRRDIAKLLETGQEATARIRVEHIIREEKMMAAQEIIELFCELITVRLPIIEAQRECPLDLKEAISSVCFAAPRCADLTELLQVQMLFAAKYGKEFVTAASELLPECGVNRKLIELLSVRAPAPDVKLKLLKEIAEEYELDWDPAASETEFLKPHEDLLNGPTQFAGGSKHPLPKEKHDEPSYSNLGQAPNEQSDSDDGGFEPFDLPEVPKASLQPSSGTASAPQMLPFPASALSGLDNESIENLSLDSEEVLMGKSEIMARNLPDIAAGPVEDKQFLPFLCPPSISSESLSLRENPPRENIPHRFLSRTRSEAKPEANVDLQDVLAAAQAAAESAERAAAAARSAASLAQVRINELTRKSTDEANGSVGNPFHTSDYSDPRDSVVDPNDVSISQGQHQDHGDLGRQGSDVCRYDDTKAELDSSDSNHQPQRLPSMDDETCFTHPNLFTRQDSNSVSRERSFGDESRSNSER